MVEESNVSLVNSVPEDLVSKKLATTCSNGHFLSRDKEWEKGHWLGNRGRWEGGGGQTNLWNRLIASTKGHTPDVTRLQETTKKDGAAEEMVARHWLEGGLGGGESFINSE